MNRRNISSSVITGAQIAKTPKLKKSIFSFAGGGVAKPTLKADTTSVDIQLQETNRILVEIQKQLSLDFANRIVEKKQAIRASKIQVTRERAASKESAIEAMRNSGAGFLKVVDKVVAPVKGIFQRILDFFSIILTGLLVNNAFKWLEDPANRAKLEKFFNFVVKHWKELLALYGAYKLIKIVGALKMIADLFKKPPKWPGGGNNGPKKPDPKPGPNDPCAGVLKCGGSILKVIKDNAVAIAAVLVGALGSYFQPRIGAPAFGKPVGAPVAPPPFDPTKDFSYYQAQGMTRSQWNKLRMQNFNAFEGGTDVSGIRKNPELSATIYGMVLSAIAAPGIISRLVSRLRGPASLPNLAEPTNKIIQSYSKSGQAAVRNPIKKGIVRRGAEKGTFDITRGMSTGGTVGGTGSGSVDSVSAMLATGEEVIRASSAMLFRPLLKDINNNAGRLWTSFSGAIVTLMRSNNELEGGIRTLKGQLDLFKKQLDQFISDEKLKKEPKGGGIGRINPPRMSGMVAPEVVLHSDIKNPPKRRAKSTVVNVPLPPQTLPPTNVPKFSADGGVANEVPSIESVNLLNPYMQLTPRLLGIFV